MLVLCEFSVGKWISDLEFKGRDQVSDFFLWQWLKELQGSKAQSCKELKVHGATKDCVFTSGFLLALPQIKKSIPELFDTEFGVLFTALLVSLFLPCGMFSEHSLVVALSGPLMNMLLVYYCLETAWYS